ncbi:MAG: cytochrome P450 [Anaerolineales bacterium]
MAEDISPHRARKSGSTRILPPSPTRASVRGLLRDPLRFFRTIAEEYGDVVCYRPAPDIAYLVNHPDHVRHVLVDNNRNYSKETRSNQIFNTVVADGLLTSEGETWRKQRRLMQPSFHHSRLAPLDGMIAESTDAMLQRWREASEAGQPIDIAREMAALTLTITTRALFGVILGDQVREIGEMVNRAARFLEKPSDPRVKQSMDELNGVVAGIIEERRRDFRDGGDLLSSMMMAHDGDGTGAMSDEELRNQVMTLMLAGYETTASALTWTWYLLSQNPSEHQRLQQEVRTVLNGRSPRYADLERLPQARNVFSEGLRLFPPAWTLGRRALGEDEIGGYYVAPGTVIAICIYTLQRHPAFWDRPDEFEPDRFTPANSAGRHRFAYIPFGAGPRQCIGNALGLMEGSLIIAHVAQHFELRLMPDTDVTPQAIFVLRPKRDLMMNLDADGSGDTTGG